jgi:predicted nucleic acid-binding protein
VLDDRSERQIRERRPEGPLPALRRQAIEVEHAVDPGDRLADDPGDNYLLAMAAASQAQYLATGDKSDLLALKQYRGTQLVTVQQLVSTLKLR